MSRASKDKILILVVDRDNDLGRKTGLATPVVGRTENLEAASSLALADPEEADANAMFAAISVLDDLSGKYGKENVEVSTVAGLPDESVEGDRKIGDELRQVLESFPAEKCVVVSDGYSDREILPVVSSRLPIMSVRNVVVRHSRSVEETWALLSRYVRQAVFDPKYSRIVLGLPSVLFILVGALILSGLGQMALPMLIIALGAIMFVRGFGVDRAVGNTLTRLFHYATSTSANQIRFFSILASISLIATAIYLGGSSAFTKILEANPSAPPFIDDPGYWVTQAPAFVGMFINGTIDMLTVGVLALVLGNGFFFYIVRYPRFWRMLQALVVTLWLWAFFRRIGFILEYPEYIEPSITNRYILSLIVIVILGLVTISLTFVLTRMLRRRYASFFKRGGPQAGEG